MRNFFVSLAISGLLFSLSTAAPIAASPELERSLESDIEGVDAAVLGALDDIASIVTSDATVTSAAAVVLEDLLKVTPTATLASVPDALSKVSSIWGASPTAGSLYNGIGEMIAAGATTSDAQSLEEYALGFVNGEDSTNNVNPRNPSPRAYPKAGPYDAPYSLSEKALRAAIYIPPTYKYGKGAQPVILVPGTGNTGYTTFAGNYIPLLTGSKIGDPVWLNIPLSLLGDEQVNAEYVAYAINYIYGISNKRKVAVFAWSAGNPISQWAYKYWPSTNCRVTDHVGFSGDNHGTLIANAAALPGEPLAPALLQQEYNSNFITALRRDGGDSAYVPTTTVYSGFFDEIVEPQQDPIASAALKDVRHVGVTNNEVQLVCLGQVAGGFYTHEGVLYNNLGFALAVDALTHDGPGRPERLNLAQVCSLPISQGLNLADVLETENTIPIAGLAILTYPAPVFNEPPIMPYARKY